MKCIGYYINCSYNDQLSKYKSFRGPEPGLWFANELTNINNVVQELYKNIIKMDELTVGVYR